MRIDKLPRTLVLVLGAAGLLVARPAAADVVGGSAKAGCYLVLKGITATKGKNKVECTDGDATCDTDGAADGKCTFAPQVCLNTTDSGLTKCTATDVQTITQTSVPSGTTLTTPATPSTTQNDCADPSSVVVALGTKKNGQPKKGKLKIKLIAESSGKPKKDVNNAVLFCLPGSGGTTSTTIPPPASCPLNGDLTAANPNTVVTLMLPTGSDLDSGWTGTSFNFPVIQDVQITACLSNCDKTTDPICDINGPTGAGSPNSATLGPPLPLVSGGVGVCVVNLFQTTGASGFTGTVDLSTGVTNVNINLFSDVYLTDRTLVCPRCETGTCSGGPNKSKPCTIHGKTRVEESLAANKIFQLSRDCPPDPGQFLARLNIPLATTTGTVTTPGSGGSKPCTENQNKGVPAQDDACGGSKCSTTPNCSGKACAAVVTNPVDGTNICVDSKGGLSQLCCNGQTAIPCHPTFPGGPGITRTGKPQPNATPTPWGDDQYPKTASGSVLVSTFCIPPTGTGTVDITSGLPGPGALIFNTDATISFTPPTP
jgi:hypothetical protein